MSNTNELQRVQKNISCLTAFPYGSGKRGISEQPQYKWEESVMEKKKICSLDSPGKTVNPLFFNE